MVAGGYNATFYSRDRLIQSEMSHKFFVLTVTDFFKLLCNQ